MLGMFGEQDNLIAFRLKLM